MEFSIYFTDYLCKKTDNTSPQLSS